MNDLNKKITFHVNDIKVEVSADEADTALVDYLNDDLSLTGTKFCCGIGECKACSVMTSTSKHGVKNKTLACLTPVSFMNEMHVYTVESLSENGKPNDLQAAFLKHFSFQCGYCTSGFLMSTTVLIERLKQNPVSQSNLDKMIDQYVGDNICRCTGYVRYLDAIREIAKPYTLEHIS
ncbi:(2Fe-2S)-binding protein [Shewanella surugensis]|uniref:2Fe-2S iron-sulfur cluster-binding protein n=1 Tax=Shewanella surugensis TaxID=212020 RepID=A0ABT0LIS3_9GAMM|nr:2Fe-2S iron-sulfur cluster-binding protein [Shewanella surugensis]MCL1127606.1 2Fe-2S iron-sulfur cluster-binding protein [Shewanella surugensis]